MSVRCPSLEKAATARADSAPVGREALLRGLLLRFLSDYRNRASMSVSRQSSCLSFGRRFARPIKPAKAEMLIIASIHSMMTPQRKAPDAGRLSENPMRSRGHRSDKSESPARGSRPSNWEAEGGDDLELRPKSKQGTTDYLGSLPFGVFSTAAVSVWSQVAHSKVRISKPASPGAMRASLMRACLHSGQCGCSIVM